MALSKKKKKEKEKEEEEDKIEMENVNFALRAVKLIIIFYVRIRDVLYFLFMLTC